MYKITFIITDLHTGGAQFMLLKLLSGLQRPLFIPRIISLLDTATLLPKFAEIDVPVTFLGMKKNFDPRWFFRLRELIVQDRPHLVQTWMYHSDLLGGLAGHMSGIPVVWNIRHSNLDPDVNTRSTLWITRLCALLSRYLPERIICCAEEARRTHTSYGYDDRRIIIIPNGFDPDVYSPDHEVGRKVRRELELANESLVTGLVGRFHPQKDHAMFIRAAALLVSDYPNLRFVLCGDDVNWENNILAGAIESAGLRPFFRLLGRRDDIPQLTNAFDIATSSSCGEGFSNVIGESMACGIPCVVTDVGDSARIVGDTGLVVPPGDPIAFAGACRQLLALGSDGRAELGLRARQRIVKNFSLASTVSLYENLYLGLLTKKEVRMASPPL